MNSKKEKLIKFWVLIASGVFLALVFFASSCREGMPRFSHQEHVTKQSLDCDTCHADLDAAAKGLPAVDVCSTCHEEAKDAAKLELAKTLSQKWPRFKILPPDGIFAHSTHKDAGVTCEECHGKMANNKKVTQENLPVEKTCLDCHTKKDAPTDCATCHKEISPTWAPKDHGQGWETAHGLAAREPIRGDRCSRCHERGYCDSCHQTQQPKDHGNTWREFGHGVASQMDRTRCQTCHRSDFCIRCHKETEPSSHRGGWGPPSDRHCLECHISTGGVQQDCSACHGARIAHSMAPRRPTDPVHATATDCRSCHTGAFLPHPDNGDDCRSCHF